jgi:hypothetical protein
LPIADLLYVEAELFKSAIGNWKSAIFLPI